MLRGARSGSWAILLAVLLCALSAGQVIAEPETNDPRHVEDLSVAPESLAGVEIKAARTAASKTYALPNGQYRSRIYSAPIHYRDETGEWKLLDPSLRLLDNGRLANASNSFDLELPVQMGTEPVRIAEGDHWVAYELRGEISEPAEARENTAIYESADSRTSFELTSSADGVKEEIVIADSSQPSTFNFDLGVSSGLTPTLTKDGSIKFLDQNEHPVFTVPAPVVSDSSFAPPASDPVHYEFKEADPGIWSLAVAVDPAWLKDPARVWPVRIDPSFKVNSPTLDCTYGGTKVIDQLKGPFGWGACGATGQKELYAKYRLVAAGDEWTRSLLRFPLSGVPFPEKKPDITAASLNLHSPVKAVNTSGVEARVVSAYSQFWTTGVNWARYNGTYPWPKEGAEYISDGDEILTSQRGTQAGWWSFTNLAPAIKKNPFVSLSPMTFLVKLLDEKGPECQTVEGKTVCSERLLTFESSAAADSSKRPYMDVTYYLPAPSSSKVTSPTDGTKTARRLKLKAGWTEAGVTGVTFQFRAGKTGEFKTIPPALVRNAKNEEVSWPIPTEGAKESQSLFFDAAHATSALEKDGGAVQVRALFEATSPTVAGYSGAVEAKVDRNVGGTRDATTSVGPGSVDLLTGNFTVSKTDVSISAGETALEFSRTHSSRDPGTTDTGVLGRGWKPGIPVEAAGGAAWRSVREVVVSAEEKEWGLENYVMLIDLDGYEYAFEQNGSGGYRTPPEAAGWLLTKSENKFSLTDPDGNRTTFENSSGGTEYLPVSVSQTDSTGTQMVYQTASGNRRLSMVIAPAQLGVKCTDTEATKTPGCRTLKFNYEPATKWGAPSGYGDRLSYITYHAAFGTGLLPAMKSWEVARYGYNAEGRLIQVWDPRIEPSLIESYSYEAGAQLKSITPPAEEPWNFEYGAHDGEKASGRLTSVKRPSLISDPAIAQTTIVYGVPVHGSGAPYDMSGATIAKWGQKDIPTDATAIFPPDQVPADPPSSYSRAAVHYLDAEGQVVNTATPSGAGTSAPSITMKETDEFGNVTRALSAQNRLRALAAGPESVKRSEELDVKRVFSADGIRLLEEWGPLHETRLESGSTVQARAYRSIQYDQGAPTPPAGTPAYGLPTRETTGAAVQGKGGIADERVTETKYAWNLRLPTDTIVDPGGLKLQTHIEYANINTSRMPVERRLPANPSGGDARSTKIIYHNAFGNAQDSSCGINSSYSGLPCKVLPVKQPGTAGQPDLVVKHFVSYSPWGQPTEVIESPGGTSDPNKIRRTITTYDPAGRVLTVKREGGGTPIPTTETRYDPYTGRPFTQRFACESSCGTSISYSSSFGSAGAGKSQFLHPAGSAFDVHGNLWVVDNNDRVQKFNAKGEYLTQFGTTGSGNGQLNDPMDIAIDADGNLWVADRGNSRVQKFNAKGEYLSKFGSAGSGLGQFSSYGPRSIGIDAQGDIWVSDYSNRIQEFTDFGAPIKAVGSGASEGQFGESAGLDVADGKIWVADWTKHRVNVFSDSGKFLFQFGSSGSALGQFSNPDAVEVDTKGNVWVAEAGNERIQQLNPEGKPVAKFGSAGSGSGQFYFAWPVGMSSDVDGNLWVSDSMNSRIQKWVASSSFDAQASTTTYDTLGRPTVYEDADGNVSSTGYDLLGRPVITSDGKGVQTRTYDPDTGLLVQLDDSAAGTFTASYNADGSLVEQGLPNGLVAETTYDEAGAPVHLSYEKTVNCVSNCTWLDFDVEESIHGQWLNQTSTLSSQQYSYDKAGRLTLVKDTPKGGSCTTRTYNYDANSNRTALITRAPGEGGVCDTSSPGKVQSYSYDTGDRLVDPEIVYDDFGRITSLPKVYSGGGTLASTYYSNDLIRSQTQDGVTNTYDLDSMLRQRRRVQSGTQSGTEIYHYSGGSDSVAWTDLGASWSRNIGGIGGELIAIQDSTKGTTLQLTSLHGDIVATAGLDPETTKLLTTFESDEFGNPKGSVPAKYSWLGGKGRRTELASGVVQMGVRSYVPAMGRFTSVDPVPGGSANSYEYGAGDPVNNLDLTGESYYAKACEGGSVGCQCQLEIWMESYRRGRLKVKMRRRCNRAGGITKTGWALKYDIGKSFKQGGGSFKRIETPAFVAKSPEAKGPRGSCRGTDTCQNSVTLWGVFSCVPNREYQITIAWGYRPNAGDGAGQEKMLTVQAQQFCRGPQLER